MKQTSSSLNKGIIRTELISVIMSTFNEKIEQLDLAIESILDQTYQELEYIIVLDNPNNTLIRDCVYDFAKKDKRIVVVPNDKNMGLTASLNKALTCCHGEYVARMDADDISDSNRLEEQLKYIRKNDLDLVGCMTRRINENGEIINALTNISYPSEYIAKKLLFDDCVAHPTWFLKKTVYEKLNGYRDIHSTEDYDFLLRALKVGIKIGICDKCLFSYRVNTSGISRSNGLKQALTTYILQDNIKKLDNINQEYINKVLDPILSEKNCLDYEKGIRLFDKAIECVKSKNPMSILYMIRALSYSRFLWSKLYRIIRIHTL